MKSQISNLKSQILLLLCCAVSAFAQQKTPPAPGPARPVNLPAITEKKLANGLTVVLAPLPNVPKITLQLTIKGSGSDADLALHPGLSGMAAQLADEGTQTRNSKQIKEELRSLGGSFFMNSADDATTISGSSLAEFSERLFALVSDVAQHPAYPEKEVTLAKDNALQELQGARSNPGFLAQERLQKAVFGNHPYSFVTADEKAIKAITRLALQQFAATRYIPNNSVLVVVGDFTPDTLLPQIEKAFGGWKQGRLTPTPTPATPKRDRRQIYFVNRPDSVQSQIALGIATIPRKHPDYFSLRTADTIFGGSFYSRLTRNIREDKGYTYSPGSSSNTQAIAGSWSVFAAVRNEVTGPTLVEMFYEMDKMRVAPVSAEELDAAKAYSTGNYSFELASQGGLAGRISTVYLYDLPRAFIADFRPKIEALTPADIQKAAAKYFDSYRLAVVIVGDWSKVKDQVTPFGEVTLYNAEGQQIKQ